MKRPVFPFTRPVRFIPPACHVCAIAVIRVRQVDRLDLFGASRHNVRSATGTMDMHPLISSDSDDLLWPYFAAINAHRTTHYTLTPKSRDS